MTVYMNRFEDSIVLTPAFPSKEIPLFTGNTIITTF